MNQLARYVRGPLILVALLIAVRYAFPNKMTFFWEVSTFGIYIIANDILYGYMGMVSFGQPFYLGVGAYAAAIYLAHIGHNIFIAAGGLLCADQRGDVCHGAVYGGKGPVSDYQR
jgi:ABC-type branched-subunit amino acid transport system permease subunit